MKPQTLSVITTSQDASAKHSPGPWKLEQENISFPPDQVFSPDNRMIADCKWSNATLEERCSNARLIASAPDLLEACTFALHLIEKSPLDPVVVRALLIKAIEKAEGKTL